MLLALKLQAREEEGKGKEGARAKHQVCARSPESRKACLREGMGNRRRKRRRRGGGSAHATFANETPLRSILLARLRTGGENGCGKFS